MPSEHIPPPIYSQEDPDDNARANSSSVVAEPARDGLQILIIPTTDTINFQKGFLGGDDERAAIEGELQIKGTEAEVWSKITVALRTIESAYQRDIELGSSEIVLFSSDPSTAAACLPSSFPFAIPLTADSPQCIHTPQSSLSHILTATLHPSDPLNPVVSKSLTVHTRRYTSHSHTVAIVPEMHSLDVPTRVEVEIPRSTFKAGESIPIYITVPPPQRELVVDQGLRLRNVKAELIRVVKVKRDEHEHESSDSDIDLPLEEHEKYPFTTDGPSNAATSAAVEKVSQSSSSMKGLDSPLFLGSSYKTVVSRSGASCRFHSSRPIRLRFVLHPSSPAGSPSDFQLNLPSADHGHLDSDMECASITQTTLLHSVTFRLNVHVSFVDMSSRTERFHTISIPVVIIPPPAPLPEVEEWIDAAYQKKHDRPPTKTVRHDDAEVSAPHYEEGQAGPSIHHQGAPPPFEERDAPPPFFSEAGGSTSTRLPTFLESEAEIYVPTSLDDSTDPLPNASLSIPGEGALFGFSTSEQFYGHTEDMQRSSTPPPTLEMASRDTNVTELTNLNEPQRAIEALGLVLEQHEEVTGGGEMPPPPPPAMDDPSDPPPSIDSDFRSPGIPPRRSSPPHSSSPTPPPTSFGQAGEQADVIRAQSSGPASRQERPLSHGHAPPPYLVPENEGDQTHVTRPPPYVDLMPPTSGR